MQEENLTKEEKRHRFYDKLKKGATDSKDEFARACYAIERDLNQTITQDYPASKFAMQVKFWNEEYQERLRQQKQSTFSSKGRRRGGNSTFRGPIIGV